MKVAAHVTFRQGNLWAMLKKHGLSAAAFGRLCGWGKSSACRMHDLLAFVDKPGPKTIAAIRRGLLAIGEDEDPAAWWPSTFAPKAVPCLEIYRDIDPDLLLAMTAPVLTTDQKLLLEESLSVLSPRERQAVEMALDGHTNASIGEKHGVCAGRASQIVLDGAAKMHRYIVDNQ